MQKAIPRLGILLLAFAVVCALSATPAFANTKSVNVVIIGGSTLDRNLYCANSGSAANVAGRTAGGCLNLTGVAGERSERSAI